MKRNRRFTNERSLPHTKTHQMGWRDRVTEWMGQSVILPPPGSKGCIKIRLVPQWACSSSASSRVLNNSGDESTQDDYLFVRVTLWNRR